MSTLPLPTNDILIGDATEELRRLPAASVDMVLTSPPYYRVRDYQVQDQIGLEPHVVHWVAKLNQVMREVHRVLKPTGTLWLNLGDSYSIHASQGAPRKSLFMGPERLVWQLVDQGWLLRNKVVWQKANPMPTSVRDRLACTWEYVYVLAREPRYHFDLDAIRVPHTTTRRTATKGAADRKREAWRGPNSNDAAGLANLHERGIVGHPLGKNPGDVWRIASSSFRGAHHATFPLELARRAIKAGCPPGGVVLDPFMGAGTTAVVAEELGRAWLGIELSPAFAQLAKARIVNARAPNAA